MPQEKPISSGTTPASSVPTPPYGWCPICGSPAVSRERRLNGNETCAKGHIYPLWQSLKKELAHIQGPPPPQPTPWAKMLEEIPPFFQTAFQALSAEDRKDPMKTSLFVQDQIDRCMEEVGNGKTEDNHRADNVLWIIRLQRLLVQELTAGGRLAVLILKEPM